ncbi:MAG: beta-ketoacyl-ACP synthase 3 [Acidobacteria bacterium]|nr:beta-ketoacyl-ACP synthase 3 [Acidobacteriota bacterium]
MTTVARILGVGAAIPERNVASEDLERQLGLPAGWIERRTGVRRRPVAAPEESTSGLAVRAGERALAEAGVAPGDVVLLLLATSTPDYPLPPTAPFVAHRLGLTHAGAVDVAGACAGFLYAVAMADPYVRAHRAPVLIIGANVLTRRVSPSDPMTAPLFADGAGAVVLGPAGTGRGVIATVLAADGANPREVWVPAGGSRRPLSTEAVAGGEHLMRIDGGRQFYRTAVRAMAKIGREALRCAGLSAADVDWWVPHQASRRLIAEAGRLLGIPEERTVDIVAEHGNSSAASIPTALASAARSDLVRPGHLVLLTAVGSGLLAASVVLEW